MSMTSAELRSLFLDYFAARSHQVVSSSSLVPHNDPTLLFTNAGMVQFKDLFLGRESREYRRAASAQRCVRAGGKHNDLENVGYTARHHTFFEMLGNFSFGDYFKEDAIRFAWEFLTDTLRLPAERLWVTVFDQDPEAEEIWLERICVDPRRFSRIGAKDNFWSMGDTGPCGPCSEIFYDHGEHIPGGPPGSPDEDGDRFIEIWNLVFMQFDRNVDGELKPLPKPSVDTGMGLERIAAVVQGVHSNYEIDLFRNLLDAAARLAGLNDHDNSSLRVLVDHIRSCAFLVVDGVLPSNEGRGYVLRRIIRRAIRHGHKLGIRDAFFFKLVEPLVREMGDAYPDLRAGSERIQQVLKSEEDRFAITLDQGMRLLDDATRELAGTVIPGETVFQLYDTFGFPVDLTADYAREHHLSLDMDGFERAMAAQRDRARAAGGFNADSGPAVSGHFDCEFTGYGRLADDGTILAIFREGTSQGSLDVGQEGVLVLDRTPFYAESGGQVGDRGVIRANGAEFQVVDTQKSTDGALAHVGKVIQGRFSVGTVCNTSVDISLRSATARNHSATHLLHAALRKILGEHVTQKGSLVDAERLRFDFSHFEPIPQDQLDLIERVVNAEILSNQAVDAREMARDDAIKAGAMALFGEKYGDRVRVLRIGDFSTELCGGTHVQRAGDIGLLKIISESGVAAGVRRIEAITGTAAQEWLLSGERLIRTLADKLKTNRDSLENKLQQVLERQRKLEKDLERLSGKLASAAGDQLTDSVIQIGDMNILAIQVDVPDVKSLRELADQLKNKLGRCALVLAAVHDGKVSLIASVSKDQIDRIKAGELVNFVATQVGGKGGGRPDMAQAGGSDPTHLPSALAAVPDWIKQRVNLAG